MPRSWQCHYSGGRNMDGVGCSSYKFESAYSRLTISISRHHCIARPGWLYLNWIGHQALHIVKCYSGRSVWTSRCRFGGIAATAAGSFSHQAFVDTLNLLVIQRLIRLLSFGRPHAPTGGMLRITLPTASHSGLFILEGRLTGLWAKELLRVARAKDQGYDNIFDLQEVFYVDSKGEEVLRWLGGRGAKFITESAYGKDLCHRLKLRRMTFPEGEGNNGKSVEGSRKSGQCRNSFGGRLDALTGADANQHLSNCRG